MKKVLDSVRAAFALFLLIGVATSSMAAPGTGPKKVKLPRGKLLVVALVVPLSSGTAHAGDSVEFRLQRELRHDGILILPEGTPVKGHVSKATSGYNCLGPQLNVSIDSVQLSDGSLIPLHHADWSISEPAPDRVRLPNRAERIIDRLTAPIGLAIVAPFAIAGYAARCSPDAQIGPPMPEIAHDPGTVYYAYVLRDLKVLPAIAGPIVDGKPGPTSPAPQEPTPEQTR